jgi:4-amino-4-deoxy-L-arabinose transferase-like glycosyltransferase
VKAIVVRRAYVAAVSATTLLAAVLRLYKLNGANPWWDEGFTYWLASQDLPGMLLRTAGDTHPPFSYLLYQLWMPLAGRTLYALRFQAALFGVATVPICAALGKRLGGRAAGIAAAILLAVSPFHIWWSQQIRMYALVALLCALSICLFVKATSLHKPNTVIAASLAAVNLVGLYTLYFFAILILLEGLFIAWLWLTSGAFARRRLRPTVYWLLATPLLLVPWLSYFRQHAITFVQDASPPLTWVQFLEASWSELILGVDTGVQAYAPVLLGLGLAAATLTGWLLVSSAKFQISNSKSRAPDSQFPIPNSQFAPWLLLVAAGLPLAAYGVTLPRGLFFSPTYQTRYDLPALPALVVLLAWGISSIWNSEFGIRTSPSTKFQIPNSKFLGLLTFAIFTGASLWSLPRLYDARHRTDDYQSLARLVEAYEQPGDVIVFDPDWNFHLFLLDYHGSLPWESIPLLQQVDASWADQAFSAWSRQYAAIWLLQEAGGHDAAAAHPVRDWLESHLRPSLQLVSGDRVMTLYAAPSAPSRQLNAGFAPEFAAPLVPGLLGFDQPLDDVRAGDVLNLTLYRAPAATSALPNQLSFGGRTFTGRALPGAAAFALPVGAWAPTGAQFIAALLPDGSQAPLSSVYVEPHTLPGDSLGPPLAHLIDRAFGGVVQLTSYQVQPERAAAGQDVSVQLQWRALGPFDANYTVFVHMLDGGKHVVAQRDSQPAEGRLPTIAWLPGQTVDDDYRITLPLGLSAGRYQLELGMYLQSTGQRLPLSDDPSQDSLIIGSIEVTSAP